jgi:MbtH protein
MSTDEIDERPYQVVLNDEEQYSIWLAERELPLGWHPEGTVGTREECLAHIGVVWTDMRPLSLRRRMAALAEPLNQTASRT